MPNYGKLCFHSGAEKEVMMGQKTGDYMCVDDCGIPINSQMHHRPTDEDWIDARHHAITEALNKIFEGATEADAATVDSNWVNEEKTEYKWEGVVMPSRFDEFRKKAEAIAREAMRIGWTASVSTGTLTNDPRKVLKLGIKRSGNPRA